MYRNQKTNNIMAALLELQIFLVLSGIIVLAGCIAAAINTYKSFKDCD